MALSANDFVLMTEAAGISLLLALGAIVCGTVLAAGLAALAFVRFALVRGLYRGLIWVIRGTPVLLLAMLLFYSFGASAAGLGPYASGGIVLSIYLAALFAEVFRGGILAIPRPLWDSGKSLGLPRGATLRQIVVPLVLRYSLPPYLNICVMAVKASSVLSIIGVWELTFASREIIERTLAVFSVLSFAALLYFLMCFGIDRLGRRVERALAAKGFAGGRP